MASLFTVIEARKVNTAGDRGVFISLNVRLAGRQMDCPVSKLCRSLEELTAEVQTIRQDLDQAIAEGASLLGDPAVSASAFKVAPEMTAEEIWALLSNIPENEVFVERFNGLDGDQRKQVAEYVLTECSIFSGRPSVFAARYDSKSGFMK